MNLFEYAYENDSLNWVKYQTITLFEILEDCLKINI